MLKTPEAEPLAPMRSDDFAGAGSTASRLAIAVERMPAFPRSVQKVLEITRGMNWTSRELVRTIEMDPVFTLKILRVVNSVQLGLSNKVTSVNQSVVYLGQNTVKNLALSIAAIGILPTVNSAGFDIERYLMHSLTTATLARQLAGLYAPGEVDPGDCYIAGLLHDFGKIVFVQHMPQLFKRVLATCAGSGLPSVVVENQVIGSDHTFVGAMLAQKWKFPPALIECIRTHHDSDAPATGMSDCLRMGDFISRQLGQSAEGLRYRQGEAPINPGRFGTDPGKVVAALGNIDRVMVEARSFAGSL